MPAGTGGRCGSSARHARGTGRSPRPGAAARFGAGDRGAGLRAGRTRAGPRPASPEGRRWLWPCRHLPWHRDLEERTAGGLLRCNRHRAGPGAGALASRGQTPEELGELVNGILKEVANVPEKVGKRRGRRGWVVPPRQDEKRRCDKQKDSFDIHAQAASTWGPCRTPGKVLVRQILALSFVGGQCPAGRGAMVRNPGRWGDQRSLGYGSCRPDGWGEARDGGEG